MATPTFAPSVNPSTPLDETVRANSENFVSQRGVLFTRPLGPRDVRFPLEVRWNLVTDTVREEIESFFSQQLSGTLGPFLWTGPDPVPSPSGVDPTLTENLSGGTLSAGTYKVAFTWYSATDGETIKSKTATITVSANSSITLTVPARPIAVPSFRAYFSVAAGSDIFLESTVTGALTYTQSANPTGSTPPPGSNTLTPAVEWFYSGELRKQRDGAFWNLSTQFWERHIG